MTQFFKDDAGELSCMRLLSTVVVVVVLSVWVCGCIAAGQYIPLGYGESGVLGAALGSKAAQGYFEYGNSGWRP